MKIFMIHYDSTQPEKRIASIREYICSRQKKMILKNIPDSFKWLYEDKCQQLLFNIFSIIS